ncbi:MAG: AI-2E family transporter, partial [Sphingomonadales bacterium]|nr:AI-2E family transporter [Sphingomonadales bacterium]
MPTSAPRLRRKRANAPPPTPTSSPRRARRVWVCPTCAQRSSKRSADVERPPPARLRLSSRRVARHAGAIIAILLALAAIWALKSVLLLLFSATLVAIILDGVARKLTKIAHMPRAAALAVGALLIVAIIGGISLLFGRELVAQLNQLLGLIPGGWEDLSDRVGEERLSGIAERLAPSGSSIFSIIQGIVTFVANMLSALLLALLGG